MSRSPEPRGVCVVRVRREPFGLVLHVTSRPDVEDVFREVEATATDVDHAVELVHRFLQEFADPTPDRDLL